MDNSLYMTAEQVSEKLGVSIPTVYTYVSKGFIRSQRIPGEKSRRYWRKDVDKMLGVDEIASPPLALQRNLVETTSITLITEHGHYYRGKSALELAKTASIEEIAALLWQGSQREMFDSDLPTVPSGDFQLRLSADSSPLQRAIAMLFSVEQLNPKAYDLSPAGYRRSGVDVLRCVAAACLGVPAPSTAPLHEFIIEALGASDRYLDAVRQLLVLAADHELDPTTYAVRAAANTGVTPYAVTIAGLVSASGRRLTFGQSSSVARLLQEIDAAASPRDPVLRRIREGEHLPGFASRNYPNGDPRAASLLAVLRKAADPNDRDLERFDIAAAAVHDATGKSPDFVLSAQLLARKIDLHHDQSALIRIPRVVGWIAHAMEQYHERDLIRPHADYAGELPD